jgi:group I intron endonuclease
MVTNLRTGVYRIKNLVNGKVYVGSAATSIVGRWKNHRVLLNAGRHHSIHLQRAWNKYGADSFEFKSLERCLPSDCLRREQVWLNFYRSANPKYGYNRSPTARSSLGVKHSPETREKMRLAHLGSVTPEHRAKITEALRRPEVRAKISKTLTGRRMPDEVRKKIGDAHRGRTLSSEHRTKISLAAHRRYERERQCLAVTEK